MLEPQPEHRVGTHWSSPSRPLHDTTRSLPGISLVRPFNNMVLAAQVRSEHGQRQLSA